MTRSIQVISGFLLAMTASAVVPANTANASFTAAQLGEIAAAPQPDAGLPLNLIWRDDNGNTATIGSAIGGIPALVIFADYTCRTLCGPILEFTAAGLAKSGLVPGVDYRLLVIGLNPRDGLDSARAMRAGHIESKSPVNRGAVFLSGDEATIRSAANAVGLHYAYDAEHDQYAHPAAVYVVNASGHVQRVMSPLGLDGGDLRLAIVDAGGGQIGTLADRIHLLCYGYDPAKGVYTERITMLLGYAAGATLVGMAGGILIMLARERRRMPS